MTSNIVTLQVGQCGIQLGASLLEALSQQESREEYTDCFFRTQKLVASDSHSIKGTIERTVARSVLVDMEPKAVNATVRTTSKEWNYDARSCFTQQSGSGNNWARGFHQYGERYADDILDRVRREVEKCDLFGGFLLMQSLAGGTGSGLGARLAQELKQEYPSTFLLNNCIWPYESGEVIVQNYNTLLTPPVEARAASQLNSYSAVLFRCMKSWTTRADTARTSVTSPPEAALVLGEDSCICQISVRLKFNFN